MLEISSGKLARIILLTREFGPDSPRLHDFISGLTDDEKADLVAVMWIGRETFDAAEVEEAQATARAEATAPTEDYLSGIPDLAEYLESGMDALGLDVTGEEDELY